MSDHLILRGQSCRCGGCGAHFRVVSTFDKHRVGPMEDRRCLNSTQMVEAGLYLDRKGFWRRVNKHKDSYRESLSTLWPSGKKRLVESQEDTFLEPVDVPTDG